MLPVRDGLNPTRLVLPHDPQSQAMFPTAYRYLVDRFPHDAVRLSEKVDAAEVVDGDGVPIDRHTPYRPRGFLYLYRDPPVEPEVPFDIPVLYQDRDLVVVDKPHFLATTPRGAYIARSVVVRLRRELGNDALSPVHRLDRLTAGVLVLTARPQVRGAYQQLFDRREVIKTYEALAPVRQDLELPVVVRSRIVKERGVLRAQQVPGEPNAESLIDLIETDRDQSLGRYRLQPKTGRTHQLRLHMAGLGIPIVGDNFFPEIYHVDQEDYRAPLQLLARSIEFTDPLSGHVRRFVSRRRLAVVGE